LAALSSRPNRKANKRPPACSTSRLKKSPLRPLQSRIQSALRLPFIICARLNKKDAILAAFPARLQNSAEEERTTALAEVFKIARLRLDD
jgi:2-oxo-4-hydroxy-4-carboxy--5-ureidoimidazoline (OHCU) decarboxylase